MPDPVLTGKSQAEGVAQPQTFSQVRCRNPCGGRRQHRFHQLAAYRLQGCCCREGLCHVPAQTQRSVTAEQNGGASGKGCQLPGYRPAQFVGGGEAVLGAGDPASQQGVVGEQGTPSNTAHAGHILVGVDDHIDIPMEAVGVGVDAPLTGGLAGPLPGAVQAVHQHQLLLRHGVVGHAAGGDDELGFRHPGADIAPGPGHQSLLQ